MRALISALIVASLALGCDSPPKRRAAPASIEEAPEKPKTAATIYAERCRACHGDLGRGDGPSAVSLAVKPRSFADPSWQAGVSDEAMKSIIVLGGQGVGKSALMPSNPDLAGDAGAPIVTDLVAMVRAFSPARDR